MTHPLDAWTGLDRYSLNLPLEIPRVGKSQGNVSRRVQLSKAEVACGGGNVRTRERGEANTPLQRGRAETALREKLNTVCIILNNFNYESERAYQ